MIRKISSMITLVMALFIVLNEVSVPVLAAEYRAMERIDEGSEKEIEANLVSITSRVKQPIQTGKTEFWRSFVSTNIPVKRPIISLFLFTFPRFIQFRALLH